VAQVAADLIDAVDARSGGRETIVVTPDNVALLETWMSNEGGLWADNPLNTSFDAARYPHQFTTLGVDTGIPIFPDIQVGIDATAATLLSDGAYAGILGVLSEGTATCGAFARAVMASPWAASHYGGDPAHFCGAPVLPVNVVGTAACPPRARPGRSGRGGESSAPCRRNAAHKGGSRGARRRSVRPVTLVDTAARRLRGEDAARPSSTSVRPAPGSGAHRSDRISGDGRRARR